MLKFIEWACTIISIIGAFLLAFRFFLPGYILFVLGTFIFVLLETRKKNAYLVILNCVYLTTSIIGLYHAI